jgi:signal transduction histidine kinase
MERRKRRVTPKQTRANPKPFVPKRQRLFSLHLPDWKALAPKFPKWTIKRPAFFSRSQSIMHRWVTNILCTILLVILVVAGVAAVALHTTQYNEVESKLENEAIISQTRMLEKAHGWEGNFSTYVRSLVEEFEDSALIELTALDEEGNVLLSSGGISFETPEKKDFEQAMKSETGIGQSTGYLEDGEHYMAYTRLIPLEGSGYTALRYVISLESVDRRLLQYDLMLVAAAVLVFALILLSNLFFLRSIVYPVRQINDIARSFAQGNFSSRVEVVSQDEIGELAESLNEMADKLQKTEQMQNEFISSVSHELRTPLTAIRGWSETLAEPSMRDDEMLNKGMNVILGETNRLSGMVEELLDFSRLQNGRLTVARTKTDLLAELEDAVMIYTERAKRDKKTLLVNEPEAVSFVLGDGDRLKQVFINIIDNALKYSEEGGVVMVDVKERDGYIIVRASDTGCGIAPEDLPRIKEKFFKANMTRRGSGIGLAVADEIVRMHDGELLVESQLGVGTTVTVRIPTMATEEERMQEAAAEERGTLNAEG